ncbi:hypothetical protein [Thermoproteus tenax]|uniref:Glycosyltransferase n=1 Tax=Thermoproteus tenax (strain ATCC 35583 / DSM 2078 / JCM 9277 / NBRC 100435 / Kra 1) TaxID=768679 RepID=G4RKA2_THETK|nr:hypothetical protein [Thermoproteus tenax]CCC81997.1 hypothetical protein TTX_1360 [Thermoproteus tenax Kra 1]
MKILALSIHNLKTPVHGGARLTLSVLGALSYSHTVLHLGLTGSEVKYDKITVKYRRYATSFDQLLIPNRIYFMKSELQLANSLKMADAVVSLIARIKYDPEIILCGDRGLFALCKLLSNKLNSKLVMMQDALRYVFIKNLKTPFAISFYAMTVLNSDASIAVSQPVAETLRKITLRSRKVFTIIPTFMLLYDNHREESHQINTGVDNALLYSGPTELLIPLARAFPQINFVVTGPLAYYTMPLVKSYGLKNIYLYHNVPDSLLEKINESVTASLIIRNEMTGISITILQSLYFGNPVVANPLAIRGYENLIRKHKELIQNVKIFNNLNQLLQLILYSINTNSIIDIKEKIKTIFDKELSPFVFLSKFNNIISQLFKRDENIITSL